MSRRRVHYGFFLQFLLVGLACLAVPGLCRAERMYEGRKFEEWVAHLNDPTEADRLKAVLAMTKFQPGPSVPALARVLLEDPSPRVREEAAIALRRIKKTIMRAVPALQQALKDPYPSVRQAAALTLAREGIAVEVPDEDLPNEEAYPVARNERAELPRLIEGLKDPDARIRKAAAETIGRMQSVPQAAVPELLDALQDPAASVRQAAGDALKRLGADAVPALVQALRSRSANERETAAWALGLLGPTAQAAAPDLRGLSTRDPSPDVSRAAELALGKIQAR